MPDDRALDFRHFVQAIRLARGFRLFVVLAPSRTALRQTLDRIGWTDVARVVSPPPRLQSDPASVDAFAAELTRVLVEEEPGPLVVDATARSQVELDGWVRLFRRLNERRNDVSRRWPAPWILALSPWLEEVLVAEAPDFWAVRSIVVEAEAEVAMPPDETWTELDLGTFGAAEGPRLAPPEHGDDLDRARGLTLAAHTALADWRHADARDLADEAIAIARQADVKREDERDEVLAHAEGALAMSLLRAGNGEEALAVAGDAVRLEERRDASSGTSGSLQARLATLAAVQARLGEHGDAVETLERAVRLCRAEVEDGTPSGQLASMLDLLGVDLAVVGRGEDAVAAAVEAVAIRRADASEADASSVRQLAMSLIHLGRSLRDLGRHDDALAALEEATRRLRSPVVDSPDGGDLALANALSALATLHAILGRNEEASIASEEAVVRLRALSARRPAVSAPLADALLVLATCSSRLGRLADAVAVTEEAVDLYRVLAEAQPTAYRAAYAESLGILSRRLVTLGRADDAVRAATIAASTWRQLAGSDAVDARLGNALDDLASVLTAAGRGGAAPVVAEGSALGDPAPTSDDPSARLSHHADRLEQLADLLDEADRHDEALEAVEQVLTIRRRLAADDPDRFDAELATSLLRHGWRTMRAGHAEAALATLQEAVQGLQRQAAGGGVDARAGLAIGTFVYAAVLFAAGRREEAIATGLEARAMYEAVVEQRPDVQGKLAAALLDIGTAALGRGQGALAAAVLREALKLAVAWLPMSPAFAATTAQIVDRYVAACASAGSDPNPELIAQVQRLLRTDPDTEP